jgi:sugar phosphate permease
VLIELGNAAVGGMTTELNFPANGLSVCTSIFYVTYVLFETPATTLLRTLRPSRLIPGVIVVWGATVLGDGFAQNYATVIACRLLLGLCEAALSPCLFLYMTTFYRREELGLRMCYLFIASAISGVIGGLIVSYQTCTRRMYRKMSRLIQFRPQVFSRWTASMGLADGAGCTSSRGL